MRPMRRREILQSSALFTLGTLSTAILGSCGNQANQPTASNAPGKAPLRLALVPWIGWSCAHIAEQKGFFKAEGIEVQQTVFQTVSEVNTALLAKQVDLAWLVAVDLLVLTEKAPDLKYIYASDYSGDVDAIVSAVAAADLKGKKIAREDIPYEVVFANKFLASVGLTEKDVEIVSLPVPDGTAAFVAGKVDAVVSYEPFIGKALKEKAGSKVLYTAKNTNVIPNGLAGSAQILQERRNDVLAYLRALGKAIKFAKDNPTEANEMVAKWVGITAPEVADQMTRIKLLDGEANKAIVFNPTNPLNVVQSIDTAGPILVKAGKAPKALPGKDLVDDSFVKAL
jgi:NitT/TauT family transport system substrate-binding protein